MDIYKQHKEGLIAPRHNLGLKEHSKEIFEQLDNVRRTGYDISLPEFLAIWCKQKVAAGNSRMNSLAFLSSSGGPKVSVGELAAVTDTNLQELEQAFLHELGIGDLGRVRVETLMASDGSKALFDETVREALITGANQAPIYKQLITNEESAENRDITLPSVDLDSGNSPERISEGETIPIGTATFTERTVKAKKFGRAIEMTYELVYFATMDIIKMFMGRIGYGVGMEVDTELCDVLLNGDVADTTVMSPGTIGVTDTAVGLQYRDLIHYWSWMAQRGINLDTLIGNTKHIEHIMNMSEFKDRAQGEPLVRTKANNLNLPSDCNMFVKSTLTDAQLIALDSTKAAVKYNVKPMLTEDSKHIINETHIAKISFYAMIGNMWRDGRIIVDDSHDRDSESAYKFSNYTFLKALDTQLGA
jgi:hypothetical protein